MAKNLLSELQQANQETLLAVVISGCWDNTLGPRSSYPNLIHPHHSRNINVKGNNYDYLVLCLHTKMPVSRVFAHTELVLQTQASHSPYTFLSDTLQPGMN